MVRRPRCALVQLSTLRHAIVVEEHLTVGANETAPALNGDHVGRHGGARVHARRLWVYGVN